MQIENNEKSIEEEILPIIKEPEMKDPSILEINVSDSVSAIALGPGQV